MLQIGGVGTIGVAVFLGLSAYAAFSDIARYRIENWISLAILADFIVFAAYGSLFGSLDPLAIVWLLGAGATLLIAGFALFAARIIGGGDAKLLAASAVWIGWPDLFQFVMLVSLMGGLLALIILGLRRVAPPRAWNRQKWFMDLRSGDHGIPYGVAIATASWLMFCPLIGRAGP